MKSKLFVLVLMVILTAIAATPLAAAPLFAPCAPGAAYDPTCDVNHDGVVNVLDVQITAGHWNQTGTWVSDNSHNHLGQTWVGANNALKIQGAFGAPDYAPLVLNNTAGVGLSIAASDSAVYIDSAGYHGLWVASAANNGLHVASAGESGVKVQSADGDGVNVGLVGNNGVKVLLADGNGVDVAGVGLAGFFYGNIQVTGNCSGCLLVTFGVNTGDRALAPGDLVSLSGLRDSGVDSVPMLIEVRTATGGEVVVGVVQGWAELVTEKEPRATEIGLRLVPRDGAASPGQYVTIAYSGLTQVKVSGPIAQGSKLAVGTDGAARALRTVNLDGVELAENASVIGVALESLGAGEGPVWVLVNPQ